MARGHLLKRSLLCKHPRTDTHTHAEMVHSLTSSVRLPGVKLSPERNAIEIGALNLTEIPRASRTLLQCTHTNTHTIAHTRTNMKSNSIHDWSVQWCHDAADQTYVDIAGPEALSLPKTIFSTDGWPTPKHTENRASQSHLRVI